MSKPKLIKRTVTEEYIEPEAPESADVDEDLDNDEEVDEVVSDDASPPRKRQQSRR